MANVLVGEATLHNLLALYEPLLIERLTVVALKQSEVFSGIWILTVIIDSPSQGAPRVWVWDSFPTATTIVHYLKEGSRGITISFASLVFFRNVLTCF